MELQREMIDLRIGRDHMVKKVESTFMRVTAKDAAEMLAACRYERQRPVRATWVSALAEMMRRGEFYEGTTLKFAEVDGIGEWVLLDGQHRLHALVESGQTCPFTITVCHVRTIEDAWRLYYTTDTGLGRTVAELLPEVAGIVGTGSAMHTRAVLSGIKILCAGFARVSTGYEAKSRDLAIENVRRWRGAIARWGQIVTQTPANDPGAVRSLARGVVVAVAVPTLHWQPERATAFWTTAVVNDALAKTAPPRQLLKYLQQQPARQAFVNAQCRALSMAWNAWMEDRPLEKMIYVRSEETAPVVLYGTPFRKSMLGEQILPTEDEFTTATVVDGRKNRGKR